MNGQSNFSPAPPDFDKMVWKCPCCNMERTDKFIKVMKHDISSLYGMETGSMVINVKYCADMLGCIDKASNRDWVLKTFLPGRGEDGRYNVEL